MSNERVLVSGGCGQIGTDLVPALQRKYGKENVITNDIVERKWNGILECFDFQDRNKVEEIIKKYKIKQIYHLACILSAAGEKIPYKTWEVNMQTLRNVLDLAEKYKLRVFWPSSIAIFGATTPKINTPQLTIAEPTTMYGITKRAGEFLCNYYFYKFGIDIRSVRFPGIISYKQEPGGGTTDFAVDIFCKGLTEGNYKSFVRRDTILPMMYMDDAIRAAMQIMDADSKKITVHTSYNLAAVSFSAGELEDELKKHIPQLQVTYEPDKRQAIADSWPKKIDDSQARKDWGWKHEFDLPKMTADMVVNLKKKYGIA